MSAVREMAAGAGEGIGKFFKAIRTITVIEIIVLILLAWLLYDILPLTVLRPDPPAKSQIHRQQAAPSDNNSTVPQGSSDQGAAPDSSTDVPPSVALDDARQAAGEGQ